MAVATGYSTLAIDRLGIGRSTHADPLNIIQAQIEVEALNEITKKLRTGKVNGVNRKFLKVVHVGHSFGAIQSYWLSALYPNNTDGIVLTGFSSRLNYFGTTVAAWNLHNARWNQPFRLGNQLVPKSVSRKGKDHFQRVVDAIHKSGLTLTAQQIWEGFASTEIGNIITGWNKTESLLDYPPGYMVTSDLTATQYVFLNPGYYDIGLAVLGEQTKQPVTTGELLTITGFPSSSLFLGPVLLFNGDADQPFCGGDCGPPGTGHVNIGDEARALFPARGPFDSYVQPNTGHALNVHYNATAGYRAIQNWLGTHGLGPF